MDAWVDRELGGEFPDRRLRDRLGQILGDLGRRVGATLPAACQDWAAVKTAYRFFSNPRIDEGVILEGHFAATRARLAVTSGPILILHDTTEFSFTRENLEAVGQLTLLKTRHATVTLCGVRMHSSLVLTLGGVPLGLAAVKFWTRKKFRGTNALRGKVNATRIPMEQKESVRWLENLRRSTEQLGKPDRCVYVGDRTADLFELFCAPHEGKTDFLVRTCVDRLAGEGDTTVSGLMECEPIRGDHYVEVRDERGRVSMVEVDLRFRRMTVHPPIGKQRRYPSLSLTVVYADERRTPEGREPIRWDLLSDLPVAGLPDAVEKLDWDAHRWKAETDHKVLKSGCRAEQARLRTAERLTNLLAVLCVVAWRVFYEPGDARGPGRGRPDGGGGRHPRSLGRGLEPVREADGLTRSRGDREAGGLPGAGEGPAAGEHGRLARANPAHGHPPRLRIEPTSCGGLKGSQDGYPSSR